MVVFITTAASSGLYHPWLPGAAGTGEPGEAAEVRLRRATAGERGLENGLKGARWERRRLEWAAGGF